MYVFPKILYEEDLFTIAACHWKKDTDINIFTGDLGEMIFKTSVNKTLWTKLGVLTALEVK